MLPYTSKQGNKASPTSSGSKALWRPVIITQKRKGWIYCSPTFVLSKGCIAQEDRKCRLAEIVNIYFCLHNYYRGDNTSLNLKKKFRPFILFVFVDWLIWFLCMHICVFFSLFSFFLYSLLGFVVIVSLSLFLPSNGQICLFSTSLSLLFKLHPSLSTFLLLFPFTLFEYSNFSLAFPFPADKSNQMTGWLGTASMKDCRIGCSPTHC